ncbi:hypothetical protein G7Y31_02550 [Corynebacterium lizhenjunii]|uniref:Uncharacterized protein n=1 Tax=Corynebacterium lizhenjunii TaxID=2709394 RepID=A0A7T0KF25_9CORY|nr:hypothetical protein [Corynebacterium lizhenjunii]QPK79610.1 hypothetical protein G7Y31_02550 [Corynebacterium lizhenjunii]
MTKLGQFITTVVIGVFAVALFAMAAVAATRPAAPVARGLGSALESIDSSNMNTAGLAIMDIYGEQWRGFSTICSGMTPDDIEKLFQVRAADLGIDGTVGEDKNYLLAINDKQQYYAEELNRNQVDLCPSGQPLPVTDAAAIVPFVKAENGTWFLAA